MKREIQFEELFKHGQLTLKLDIAADDFIFEDGIIELGKAKEIFNFAKSPLFGTLNVDDNNHEVLVFSINGKIILKEIKEIQIK